MISICRCFLFRAACVALAGSFSVAHAASPTVNISPSTSQSITVGQSVTFSSTATDPDGDLQVHRIFWQDPEGRWSWQEGSGANGLTLSGPADAWYGGTGSSSRSITVTADRTGTFVVQWGAADPGGWVDSAAVTLVVNAANTPPTVTISPTGDATLLLGNSFTTSSDATDPDGNLQAHSLSWQDPDGNWSWSGNATGLTLNGPETWWSGGSASSSRSLTATPTRAGVFHIQWSALDPDGWVNTATYALTVSADTRPVVTISPSATVTAQAGETVTFNSTANDPNGDMQAHSFSWQDPAGHWNWEGNATGLTLLDPKDAWYGGASTSSRSMRVQATQTGTFHVRWSALDANGWTDTADVALVVQGNPLPPDISTQPQSQTVPAGSSVTFTVVASGSAPLTYQWRKDGANIGTNSATLALNNVQVANQGSYDVTVTNSAGSKQSEPATLTVTTSPPQITAQPQNQIAPLGSSVTFNVTATGTAPLAYQWKKNTSPISGATDAAYTIQSVQNSDVAGYTVTVTNAQASVTSDPATLTIGDPPSNETYAEADYADVRPPPAGAETMHILTPTLLELVHISRVTQPNGAPDSWNWVNHTGPAPGDITVSWTGGGSTTVTEVGFRRHTLHAPRKSIDQSKPLNMADGPFEFTVTNHLFLKLNAEIPEGANVDVTVTFNRDNHNWEFHAKADPLRFNPALHVNQEGYLPGASWPKIAFVGYYLGDMGELTPATLAFHIIDTNGTAVANGTLDPRHEVDSSNNPVWYNQVVYEADFTSAPLAANGVYRLKVDKMGVSFPFRVDSGIAYAFARTYALGLYHQRCGTALLTPFTRFTHDICHDDPVYIPWDNLSSGNERVAFQSSGPGTLTQPWDLVTSHLNNDAWPSDIVQQQVGRADATLALPFERFGMTATKHGHHDAGDYSRYIYNSAALLHYLLFAVDNLPGVAALNNLGTPRDGTSTGDLLRAAKWEADFLASAAEKDNANNATGFYYLVYPRFGEYEGGPPNNGVEQSAWPKQSAVTASGIAALLQAANCTAFNTAYPADAAKYRTIATTAWTYLEGKITAFGGDYGGQETNSNRMRPSSAYQYIQHFGNEFADVDDLAWALCEMYLETGNGTYQDKMKALYQPVLVRDPSSFRNDTFNGATLTDSYRHMSAAFGNAARSYVFAQKHGRLPANADSDYKDKLTDEIYKAADDMLAWSSRSAYRLNFPDAAKPQGLIGWYFAGSWAFDLAVGDALSQYNANGKVSHADVVKAILATLNYEAGGNPVNVAMVSGIGRKRQNVLVSQYSDSDFRLMPMSGIPVGTVRQRTVLYSLNNYQVTQNQMQYPTENLGSGYAL